MTINVAEMEIIAITMCTSRLGWKSLTPAERKEWREIAKRMMVEATADFESPFPDGHVVIKNPEEKKSFTGFDAGAKARREAGIGQRSHKKPILIGIPLSVQSITPSFFLGLVEPSVMRIGLQAARQVLVFDASASVLESIHRSWTRVEASLTDELFRVSVTNVGESDAGYTTLIQVRNPDGKVVDEVDCGDFDSPEDAEASITERGGRIVRAIWDEQKQDGDE